MLKDHRFKEIQPLAPTFAESSNLSGKRLTGFFGAGLFCFSILILLGLFPNNVLGLIPTGVTVTTQVPTSSTVVTVPNVTTITIYFNTTFTFPSVTENATKTNTVKTNSTSYTSTITKNSTSTATIPSTVTSISTSSTVITITFSTTRNLTSTSLTYVFGTSTSTISSILETVSGTSTSFLATTTTTGIGTTWLTSTQYPWTESDTSTITAQSNVVQTQISYTSSTSLIWATENATFSVPVTVTPTTVTETARSTSSYVEQVRVGAFSTPLWQLGLVVVFGVALGATKTVASYFDKGKQKKGKFRNESDEERKKRTIAQGQRKFRDQFLSLAHRGKLPADAKRPQPQHEHPPADITVQQGPPEFEHQAEPVQAVSLGSVLDKILEPPTNPVSQEPPKATQTESVPKAEEKDTPKETPKE